MTEISGIPAEHEPLVVLVVGLLSSALVGPLTAIAKKLGGTTGPSTVAISAALSLVVAFGFEFARALAGEQRTIWSALLIAFIAFSRSNGEYVRQKFLSKQDAQKENGQLPLNN